MFIEGGIETTTHRDPEGDGVPIGRILRDLGVALEPVRIDDFTETRTGEIPRLERLAAKSDKNGEADLIDQFEAPNLDPIEEEVIVEAVEAGGDSRRLWSHDWA